MPQRRYIMTDQVRGKVHQIMDRSPAGALVTHPSWLALALLVAAVNLIAISSV